MGERRAVTLGAYVDILTGFPFTSRDYVDNGIRLLRGDNIAQGRLRWQGARWWPTERAAEVEQYRLAPGDVVLAMDRPWIEAGLKYAPVRSDDSPSLLVQRVARLRARDDLDQRFLLSLIGSRAFTDHVLAVQTGTAVPHISARQIREFKFALPPPAEQRAIAEVLGALDDKIDANARIAAVVLRLAVALYQEAVSGSSDLVALGKLGRWLSGGTPKTADTTLWGGDIPWISAASLKSFFVASSERTLTDAGAATGTRLAPEGAILFVVRGMSLKTEFRVGVAQREVAFGQDCKAIVVDDRYPSATVAVGLAAARDKVLTLVDEAGHGTGRLPTDRIERLEIALPQTEKSAAIEEVLSALLARGAIAEEESRRLGEMRDALLPPLISGELTVRDGDALVGEAV